VIAMKQTLYQILDVDPKASAEAIRAAYERLAAMSDTQWPDANMPGLLRQASEVLLDPKRRLAYDASLAAPVGRSEREARIDDGPTFIEAWGKWIVAAVVLGGVTWWGTTRREAPPTPKVEAPAVMSRTIQSDPQSPAQTLAPLPEASPQPVDARPASTAIAVPPVASARSAEDVFADVAPSVARVNVMDASGRLLGSGSGVVIDKGVLLTSCHVATIGATLAVKLGDATMPATILLADEAYDLCRLAVPGMQAPSVTLTSVDALRTGQRVYAIGAPQGLELTISEGIVSALRKVDEGTVIQTTAPISPGSSGGGLFDMAGHLVGIMTFQHRYGQNLNFALPADWIGRMRARRASEATWRSTAIAERSQAASPLTLLIGRWLCRDWTSGRTAHYSFEVDGRVSIAMNDARQAATLKYGVSGKTLQLVDAKQAYSLMIEELTARTLILHARDKSIACERQ
jgi:hypothetical protein